MIRICAKLNFRPSVAQLLGLFAGSFLAGSALAADLPYRKAPPVVPPAPVFTWTGFYVGGTVGAQAIGNDWLTTGLATPPLALDGTQAAHLDQTDFRVGGFLGYNLQFNSNFVAGLEGDLAGDFGSRKTLVGIPGDIGNENINIINSTVVGPPLDRVSADARWDASVRGRLGYLVTPSILLYGTGGVAFEDARTSIACPGPGTFGNDASFCAFPEAESKSKTLVGWTLGAGIEAKVYGNWLVRAQYRYSDFGTQNLSFFANTNAGTDLVTARSRISSHIGELGVAYTF